MLNIKNILKEADVILFICTLVVTKYLIDDLKREKKRILLIFSGLKFNLSKAYRIKVYV